VPAQFRWFYDRIHANFSNMRLGAFDYRIRPP
jgi:hypothetical protein